MPQHFYHSSRLVAEILRATLRDLEQATDPSEPAYIELRRIILLRIASLEAEQIDTAIDETSN